MGLKSVLQAEEAEGQLRPVSQEQFASSPFEPSRWMRVGDIPADIEKVYRFESEEFPVLESNQPMLDAMFRDFGGREAAGNDVFWHGDIETVRKNLAAKESPADDGPPTVTLTEEQLQGLIDQRQQEAFAAGVARGHEEAKGNIEQSILAIRKVIHDFEGQVGAALDEIERKSGEFCLTLIERLVRLVLEVNPEVIVQLIGEALRQVHGSKVLCVKVSPADLELISSSLSEQVDQFSQQFGFLEFVADDKIKMGCVVETSRGSIEIELEQALERIRASLS